MVSLQPWGCKLIYFGRREKPDMEKLGAKLYTDLKEFVAQCDVVTINLSLSDKTEGMINKDIIDHMKDGAYLINNARGAIVSAQAVSHQDNLYILSGFHSLLELQGKRQTLCCTPPFICSNMSIFKRLDSPSKHSFLCDLYNFENSLA